MEQCLNEHVGDTINVPHNGFTLFHWLAAGGVKVPRNVAIHQHLAKKKKTTFNIFGLKCIQYFKASRVHKMCFGGKKLNINIVCLQENSTRYGNFKYYETCPNWTQSEIPINPTVKKVLNRLGKYSRVACCWEVLSCITPTLVPCLPFSKVLIFLGINRCMSFI